MSSFNVSKQRNLNTLCSEISLFLLMSGPESSLKLINEFSSASCPLSALHDLIFLKIKFLHLEFEATIAIIKISPPMKIPIWLPVDSVGGVDVVVGAVVVVDVVVDVVVVIKGFVVSLMT